MAGKMRFSGNVNDLSNDNGYQFEITCGRCGNGYRSKFQPSVAGGISQALDAAGSIFGGLFGTAADLTNRAKSATWQKAHDDALERGIGELLPDFVQCPRCQVWVCRRDCWNNKRGLCKSCAPDLGVEMSAAQADKARQAIWEKAEAAQEDTEMLAGNAWKDTVKASCPECGKPLEKRAKFCPECGAKLDVASKCAKCGAKLTPNAKFCPECGAKAN